MLRPPECHQAGNSPGHALLALARTVLDTIVHCHEAVLQDDGETLAIIDRVVRHSLRTDSLAARVVESATEIEANLRALLRFTAQSHEQPLTERLLLNHVALPSQTEPLSGIGSAQNTVDALTNWFFKLSRNLNAAHPQAAQVLRARLLGLDSRTIADRLQLPHRLVQRVFTDLG